MNLQTDNQLNTVTTQAYTVTHGKVFKFVILGFVCIVILGILLVLLFGSKKTVDQISTSVPLNQDKSALVNYINKRYSESLDAKSAGVKASLLQSINRK